MQFLLKAGSLEVEPVTAHGTLQEGVSEWALRSLSSILSKEGMDISDWGVHLLRERFDSVV